MLRVPIFGKLLVFSLKIPLPRVPILGSLVFIGIPVHSFIPQKVLDINLCWLPLPLLFALDQPDSFHAVQLRKKPNCLTVPTAQQFQRIFQSKIDIDTVLVVHPAIFHRQAHPIQHQSIEDFGFCGKSLKAGIGKKDFWYLIKVKLLRLIL